MESFIIESDGISEIIDKKIIKSSDIAFMKRKAIDGNISTYIALVPIATVSISAAAKILVELIKKNRNQNIIYKGKSFGVKIENTNVNEAVEFINEIIEKTK